MKELRQLQYFCGLIQPLSCHTDQTFAGILALLLPLKAQFGLLLNSLSMEFGSYKIQNGNTEWMHSM